MKEEVIHFISNFVVTTRREHNCTWVGLEGLKCEVIWMQWRRYPASVGAGYVTKSDMIAADVDISYHNNCIEICIM
jgi:hypothetical protein